MRLSVVLLFSLTLSAQNWPSFRGPAAAGVAEKQSLPDRWDAKQGTNVRWKLAIPGLAHSSPIVWRDLVFLTTAVSSKADASFKRGLYGDGTASDDRSVQQWKLYAVDLKTGKVAWDRIAYQGAPKEKRHIKSTYANATPATDGEIVVAFFGSQGVYAFDFKGKQLWSRDLGRFDAGAYDSPDYEWGTASSPVISGDSVILQCDQQKGSFLIALDRRTGRTLWRTERDELPSWGTPGVFRGAKRSEIVTNGSNFIRGYDPASGKELWRLGGSSKITAPTPVFSGDLIFVASGRRPEAPIFAIRGGASGDITNTPAVAWNKVQRGSYMPTPLVYGNFLYVLNNNGVFDCYEAQTGKEVYRKRLEHSGSGFSASPVASDGRIFIPEEDGEIYIVRAGAEFELLGKMDMGESLMATPAIAHRTLIVRGERHLWAIGSKP